MLEDTRYQKKDINELVDIKNVIIDRDLPIEERIRSYIDQIKDPYQFRVGDVRVHVSYANNKQTLDDSFETMISSI